MLPEHRSRLRRGLFELLEKPANPALAQRSLHRAFKQALPSHPNLLQRFRYTKKMPRQQAYSTIDGSTPSRRRKALLAVTGAGALMLVAASASIKSRASTPSTRRQLTDRLHTGRRSRVQITKYVTGSRRGPESRRRLGEGCVDGRHLGRPGGKEKM